MRSQHHSVVLTSPQENPFIRTKIPERKFGDFGCPTINQRAVGAGLCSARGTCPENTVRGECGEAKPPPYNTVTNQRTAENSPENPVNPHLHTKFVRDTKTLIPSPKTFL